MTANRRGGSCGRAKMEEKSRSRANKKIFVTNFDGLAYLATFNRDPPNSNNFMRTNIQIRTDKRRLFRSIVGSIRRSSLLDSSQQFRTRYTQSKDTRSGLLSARGCLWGEKASSLVSRLSNFLLLPQWKDSSKEGGGSVKGVFSCRFVCFVRQVPPHNAENMRSTKTWLN